MFTAILPKLKQQGIVWINLGDSYNTPIKLGSKGSQVQFAWARRQTASVRDNAAYTKPRFKRKAFIDSASGWLQYGNLLMLPQRLLIALVESGYIYRGEGGLVQEERDAGGTLPPSPSQA